MSAAETFARLRAGDRPRLVTPTFLLVQAATLLYFVGVGALLPVLPRYVEGPLGGGSVAVGFALGSFSATAVLLRPLAGRLADRRGRRLMMLMGSAVVTVATLGYVGAASIAVLIVLRLLSGAGEAFFFTGATAAVNDLAPDERRGEAMSFFSLALYGGIAIGPFVGELILGEDRFDAVWLVGAGLAAAAALLLTRVPETRPAGLGPGSSGIVHRAAILPGIVIALSVWGFAGFASFVPLYALDLGLPGSRFVYLLYAGIVILIRSVGARVPDVLGPRRVAAASLASSALGLILIGAWPSAVGLFSGTALFSIGQALAFPALMTVAVAGTPAAERGAVVGTFTAFVDLAFGIGPVTLGAVAAFSGYRGAFVAGGLFAAAGLAVMLFSPAMRSRTDDVLASRAVLVPPGDSEPR